MKRQVRYRTFETNSSSTHSVSVVEENSSYVDNSLSIGLNDNKIHVEFGEFGWGFEKYRSIKEKLSYALTMVISTEGHEGMDITIKDKEDFYELEGFKLVENAIKERYRDAGCEGIVVDSKIEVVPWSSDTSRFFINHDGYIDHQSCEYYNSLDDFLVSYGVSIEDFLFNPNYVLYIMNDNSYKEDRKDFMERGRYND